MITWEEVHTYLSKIFDLRDNEKCRQCRILYLATGSMACAYEDCVDRQADEES
ncbi:MAG: hypothetical protein ACYTEQ_00815 [Planctomycetota bacterium]|jgi:hypothetical protein